MHPITHVYCTQEAGVWTCGRGVADPGAEGGPRRILSAGGRGGRADDRWRVSSNYPPSVSPVRLPHTLRLRQIVVLHAQQGGSAICLTTLPSVPPVRLPLMGNTGVATHLSCTCVLDANPNASPCNVITTITIVAICRRVVTLVVG